MCCDLISIEDMCNASAEVHTSALVPTTGDCGVIFLVVHCNLFFMHFHLMSKL
jgi:hypothetical protein